MLAFAPSLVKAQACDPSTPVYYVDLTGQPNGTYISPADVRDGLCCGAQSPDKCIAFVITLDSAANGIIFNIASGAVPPGALFYQVGCGPPVAVGSILCLNGPGPHYLTFCKPGNNQNTYSITSLPQPTTYGSTVVSQACSGQFGVSGLEDTTIVWSSIPNNPIYNSYLSCTTGCTDVTLTPPATGLPPTITYQVCGYVIGGCFPFYFCDTFVVNMVNVLDVNITPQNQTICYGGPDIPITANVTGGIGPYQYIWSTGETTPTIIVGPGVYTVQLVDSLNCSISYDTVTVNGIPSAIVANAGTDQILCTTQPITNLNGSVQTATGGIWSGGTGTFIPGNTNLNATYIPSATEINAGFAQLILTTTGNQGCPAVTDTVLISTSPNPAPVISGPSSMCVYTTQSYTTPYVPGNTYFWTVTGGTIINTLQNNITVLWGAAGNGTVNVLEVNTSGCDSAVTIPVIINPEPAPVINGPGIVCTLSGSTFTVASPQPGSSYQWNISGGTVAGSTTGSSVQVNWNIAGSASITLTEINSYGCDSTVTIPVTILTQPTPSIAGAVNGCAGQSMTYTTPFVTGNSYTWSVTGGTITSNNNNAVTVFWPTATTGILTLTESNSLSCDSTVTLNVVVGPQPAPAITGIQTVCTGTTFTYSVANPVPGDLYQWSVTGGVIMNASNSTSVNIFWQQPGQATITLQQLNSFGCDSIVSIPVQILIQPTPAITGAGLVCAGQTVTYSTPLVTGNTYNWNVTGGIVVSNNNNSITVTWPTATSGSVSLTEANTLTCDSTVTMNVAVGAQPAPGISGTQTMCTGNITTFYVTNPVAGDFYQWSITGGTLMTASNGTSIQVYFSQPGQANVSVYQINGYGCDSLVSIPVQVLTQPAPAISGNTTGCAGQSFTYSTPLVSGNTYNWSVTGGIITSMNQNTVTVYWPTGASGTLSVTEANTLACDSTVTIQVIIGPQPAPSVLGNPTVCVGNIETYSLSVPVAGDLYQWSVTGGVLMSSPNSVSVQIAWTTAGTGTVSVNQSNGFGCDSTVTFNVTVLTMPQPTISGNATACAGQSITYTTPFVSGHTYQWSVTGGTITSTNNNTITVFWPIAANGSVTLNESNTLACDSSLTLYVVVGDQPAPSMSGPVVVCTNDHMQYTLTNFTAGNNFVWTVNGGIIIGPANGSSITVVWTIPGQQTISVTESNVFGCNATVNITVQVRLKPAPTLTGPTSGCEATRLVYAVQNLPGHSYFWTVTGGSVIGTVVNHTIEVLWTTPGPGSVSVNVISPLGCDSLVSMPVIIYSTPNPALMGPPMVCSGEHVTLFTNAQPGNIYTWNATNATFAGSTSGNTVTVIPSVQGVTSVTVTETTVHGCENQATFYIMVNETPAPVISGSNVGCISGQQYQYSTPAQAYVAYQWGVTGGNITSGMGTNAITVEWANPGNQIITLTATNILSGCDSTIQFNVLTGSLPPPVINAPSLSGCAPLSAAFTGNTAHPDYNYFWDFGDGTTGYGSNPIHNYFNPGTYNVTLSASNNTGCASIATATINVYPSPVSSFQMSYGGDIYYTSTSILTLNNYSQGAVSYLWDFGNGDTSTAFEPQFGYNNTGSYTVTLTATNQYGCISVSMSSLQVKSPEHLYVPNAFSPNGDGTNDFFDVGNWNIINLRVNIYNRWGDMIYTSGNPDFRWDGTHHGRPVQEGVYVYQIAAIGIHGEEFDLTGTVTVVR